MQGTDRELEIENNRRLRAESNLSNLKADPARTMALLLKNLPTGRSLRHRPSLTAVTVHRGRWDGTTLEPQAASGRVCSASVEQ